MLVNSTYTVSTDLGLHATHILIPSCLLRVAVTPTVITGERPGVHRGEAEFLCHGGAHALMDSCLYQNSSNPEAQDLYS